MKTRDEMRAEIEAGLLALLRPLVGEGLTEARKSAIKEIMSDYMATVKGREYKPSQIEVTSCEAGADGVMHLRIRLPPEMAHLAFNIGEDAD